MLAAFPHVIFGVGGSNKEFRMNSELTWPARPDLKGTVTRKTHEIAGLTRGHVSILYQWFRKGAPNYKIIGSTGLGRGTIASIRARWEKEITPQMKAIGSSPSAALAGTYAVLMNDNNLRVGSSSNQAVRVLLEVQRHTDGYYVGKAVVLVEDIALDEGAL